MAAVFYATLSATQEDYGTASAAGLILTLGFVSASCLLGVVDLVVRTWPLVGELDAEAYLVALVLVADHEAVDGALRVSPTRRRPQEGVPDEAAPPGGRDDRAGHRAHGRRQTLERGHRAEAAPFRRSRSCRG